MCVCVCVSVCERECVCPLPESAMERKEREKERECYFRRDRIPTALLRLMTSRTIKGTYLPSTLRYIPIYLYLIQ